MGTRKAKKLDTTVTSTPTDAIAPVAETIRMPGEGLGITIGKRELGKAIQKFQSVVDRKSTMPMLANVLIRADHGGITITGTDLDVSLHVRVDACKVARTGAIYASAKRLADMIRTLPDGDVAIYQTSKTNAIIASGSATLALEGYPDRDAPKFPSLGTEDVRWVAVDASTLASMIDRVKHSVCLDDTRFHLNGLYWECDSSALRMVTTDGHRLSKAEAPIPADMADTPTGIKLAKGAIVPRKGCLELGKMLAKQTGNVDVMLTKTHAWFRLGGTTLVAKLVDAQFPPYAQVIPTDHRRLVTIDSTTLAAAMTRAKVNCTDARGAKLSLATGKLTIEASDPDSGTITECLDVDYIGTECTIGVNARYLLDTLGQIDAGPVVLAFGTERAKATKGDGILDPMLVRSLDDAVMRPIMGARFLSVIMPMRV